MFVLIVAHHLQACDALRPALIAEGHAVSTAITDATGIALIHAHNIDLAIVELSLPDMRGFEVLRELCRVHGRASAYALTGDSSVGAAIAAMKLGATDCIGTTVDGEALLLHIRSQLKSTSIANETFPPAVPLSEADTPPARRWAALVLSAVSSADDLKTRVDLARAACLSVSTLENRCRSARVKTKATLDLARVLCALVKAKRLRCEPEAFIDADPRTLRRLVALAGGAISHVTSVEEFLRSQRFVTESLPLDALRDALRPDYARAPGMLGPPHDQPAARRPRWSGGR